MNAKSIRHTLHTLAETAGHEKETAAFVERVLEESGLENRISGVGGYGLLALADSGKPGPFVLFRAELDALPIPETIKLNHASRTAGVSHKCGHDGHMAILLQWAKGLSEKPLLNGKAGLLFQPAEETGEGAALMLNDERMTALNPDYVFALHNLPGYPLGNILLRRGVFASGSVGLIVRLNGQTAHAAHPQAARSPAPAVAALIQGWQSLPPMVVPFDRAALLTVIHARIGERAFGTTPGYAEVMATLRAHEPDDLEGLCQRAEALALSTAKLWNLDVEIEWTEVFHPTVNKDKAVDIVEEAVKRMTTREGSAGIAGIRMMERPFSWSEDFGRFTERWPGALIGIGAGETHPQLHDPGYDFPDELLPVGKSLLDLIVDELKMR